MYSLQRCIWVLNVIGGRPNIKIILMMAFLVTSRFDVGVDDMADFPA